MTDKEINDLFHSVLDGLTVMDILETPEFYDAVKAELEQQRALRIASRAAAGRRRLPSHTVDKFMDCPVQGFIDDAVLVLAKKSLRPYAERKYIAQLTKVAYDKAVRRIVAAKSPEYAAELKRVEDAKRN